MMRLSNSPLSVVLACLLVSFCHMGTGNRGSAADFFLTIGGGYARSGNQASIERNVLFYQRTLLAQQLEQCRHDIYFADGHDESPDVQVLDRESVPIANRLMAEFFGSETDLGLHFRNAEITGVRDSTDPKNIRNWFTDVGSTMKAGDRLLLYVTSHGHGSTDKQKPYNTSIALWRYKTLHVTELAELLDSLPDGVRVVTVMVQCHAGGFARLIYEGGDPEQGLASQPRCGFFATFHDRSAAGCTAEANEESYVEYSTYFWEAISGVSRMGEPIDAPDYDNDGVVSFAEAHAYTILQCDTIDVPLKTSTEFLRVESRFGDDSHRDLLPRDTDYSTVLGLASDVQRVVIEGLSEQLELTGENRLDAARRLNRRRREPQAQRDSDSRLRRRIASDLQRRWPELANLMNPLSIELVTTRRDEFVAAVESHRDYRRYRELVDGQQDRVSDTAMRAKRDRFVLTIEEIILAENLRRSGDTKKLAEYEQLLKLESGTLGDNIQQ